MLRGAILGLGNIALGGHLPIYHNHPEISPKVNIVAAADLCENNRGRAAELYPEMRVYESAEALLAQEELDFIDICTPPDTHLPLIRKAVENSWHILCEKPLVTNMEDLREIAGLLENPKVVFKPIHQYLYSPHWQAVASLCETEKINPYFFQARVLRTGANQGNREWTPGWRTDPRKSGGGIIVDHGVHLFYLAVSMLGQPRKITTLTQSLKHNYDVEDTAVVLIEHERGGLTEISLSWAAQRRQIEFLVLGADAEILVEENRVALYKNNDEKLLTIPTGLSSNSTHQSWYPPLLGNFINKMINSDFGSEKLREALTATKCALGAYLSAKERRAISLEEL